MTTKRVRKPKLRLACSDEKQRYVQVPIQRSAELLGYLRRNGLQVSPPEPCTTESETIAFVGTVDEAAIQGLLNRWK